MSENTTVGGHYRDLLLTHAKDLIRIDSSNPPGEEKAVADYCADAMAALGLDVSIMRMEGTGHYNVTGTLKGRSAGLALCGHMDVVPAGEGWTKDPFSPIVQDGKLYGRGSCDMKGALAAMLTAARVALDHGYNEKRGFSLCFTGDEEDVCKGAIDLVKNREYRPVAAIVGEPTELAIHTGTKGYSQYLIRTNGTAAHASQPENGDNAIYKMARAIHALEEYAREVRSRSHPALGAASFNIGTVHGGTKVNVVPCYCEADTEYRLLPGDTAQRAVQEMTERTGGIAEIDIIQEHPAVFIEEAHPLVQAMVEAFRSETGKKAELGVFPAFSEMGIYQQGWGVPALLFGPGSINLAHKPDEYVPLEELYVAAGVYARLLAMD